MDSKFYLNRYSYWKQQYGLRILELVLCVLCLTVAIICFYKQLYFVTKLLMLVVTSHFLFITFVDLVSWHFERPMGYKTWIMIATTAFLMFWLCAGFLIFLVRSTAMIFLIMVCCLFIITGLIFLFDCLMIVIEYLNWTNNNKVSPGRQYQDKGVPTCFLFSAKEPPSEPVAEVVRLARRPSLQKIPVRRSAEVETIPKRFSGKPKKPSTGSYGGTFFVSKDLPPLPSPEVASRDKQCTCRSSTDIKVASERERRWSVDKQVQTELPDVTTKLTRMISEKISFYGPYSSKYPETARMGSGSERSLDSRRVQSQHTSNKHKSSIEKRGIPQYNMYDIPSSRGSHSDHGELVSHDRQTTNKKPPIGSRYSNDSLQVEVFDVPTKDEYRHPHKGTQASHIPSFNIPDNHSGSSEQPQKPYETDDDDRTLRTAIDGTSRQNFASPTTRYKENPSPSLQDSVWHQYYQNPCKSCGKTHFHQQTTISGVLSETPYYCNCRDGTQAPCSKLANKKHSSGTQADHLPPSFTSLVSQSETDDNERTKALEEMIVAYNKGVNRPSLRDSISHQYHQMPCERCGKTHFQEQTSISGCLSEGPVYCKPRVSLSSNVSTAMNKKQGGCKSSTFTAKRNGLDSDKPPCPAKVTSCLGSCDDCRYTPVWSGRRSSDVYGSVQLSESVSTETEPKYYVEKSTAVELHSKPAKKCTCPKSKSKETMIRQEMRHQEVQSMKLQARDHNPQTSETRLLTADILESMIRADGKPYHEDTCCAGCGGETGNPDFKCEVGCNTECPKRKGFFARRKNL